MHPLSFPYIRKEQLSVYKESINDTQPTVKSIKFLMHYSGKWVSEDVVIVR